jgi:hypothetical protein
MQHIYHNKLNDFSSLMRDRLGGAGCSLCILELAAAWRFVSKITANLMEGFQISRTILSAAWRFVSKITANLMEGFQISRTIGSAAWRFVSKITANLMEGFQISRTIRLQRRAMSLEHARP